VVDVYYLDTSAALKAFAAEAHSVAFRTFFNSHADAAWVSSALMRVEVLRAVRRAMPGAVARADELLLAFAYHNIDDGVVDTAASEPDQMLRSLDAIHLATARTLGSELTGLITYDDRLAGAATNAGIAVISPRD
jgi:uncharacterized protein